MKQIYIHNMYINIHNMQKPKQQNPYNQLPVFSQNKNNMSHVQFQAQSLHQAKNNITINFDDKLECVLGDVHMQKYQRDINYVVESSQVINEELGAVKAEFMEILDVYKEKIRDQALLHGNYANGGLYGSHGNINMYKHGSTYSYGNSIKNNMSGYTNYSNYNQNIFSSNSNNTGRHRNPTIMLYSNIATNLNKLTSPPGSTPTQIKISSQEQLTEISKNYNKILAEYTKIFKEKQLYRIEIEKLKNKIIVVQEQNRYMVKDKVNFQHEVLYCQGLAQDILNRSGNGDKNQIMDTNNYVQNYNINKQENIREQALSKQLNPSRHQSHNKNFQTQPETTSHNYTSNITYYNSARKSLQPATTKQVSTQRNSYFLTANQNTNDKNYKILNKKQYSVQKTSQRNPSKQHSISQSLTSFPVQPLQIATTKLQLHQKNTKLQQQLKKLQKKYNKLKNQFKQYQNYQNNKNNLYELNRQLYVKQAKFIVQEEYSRSVSQKNKQIQLLKDKYQRNNYTMTAGSKMILQHNVKITKDPSTNLTKAEPIPQIASILYKLHNQTLPKMSTTILQLKTSLASLKQIKHTQQIQNKLKIFEYEQQIQRLKKINQELSNKIVYGQGQLQQRLIQKDKYISVLEEKNLELNGELLRVGNLELIDGFRLGSYKHQSKEKKPKDYINAEQQLKQYKQVENYNNTNIKDFNDVLKTLQKRLFPKSANTPENPSETQPPNQTQTLKTKILNSYLAQLFANLSKSSTQISALTSTYKYYKQEHNKILNKYLKIQNQYNIVHSRLCDYQQLIRNKLDLQVGKINHVRVYQDIDYQQNQPIIINKPNVDIQVQNSQTAIKLQNYRKKYNNLYKKFHSLENYLQQQIKSINLYYEDRLSELRVKIVELEGNKSLAIEYKKENQSLVGAVGRLRDEVFGEKFRNVRVCLQQAQNNGNVNNLNNKDLKPPSVKVTATSTSTGSRAFIYRSGSLQQVQKPQTPQIPTPPPTCSNPTLIYIQKISQLHTTILTKQQTLITLQQKLTQLQIQNHHILQQLRNQNQFLKKHYEEKLENIKMENQMEVNSLNIRIQALELQINLYIQKSRKNRHALTSQTAQNIQLQSTLAKLRSELSQTQLKNQLLLTKNTKLTQLHTTQKHKIIELYKIINQSGSKISLIKTQHLLQTSRLQQQNRLLTVQNSSNIEVNKIRVQLENIIKMYKSKQVESQRYVQDILRRLNDKQKLLMELEQKCRNLEQILLTKDSELSDKIRLLQQQAYNSSMHLSNITQKLKQKTEQVQKLQQTQIHSSCKIQDLQKTITSLQKQLEHTHNNNLSQIQKMQKFHKQKITQISQLNNKLNLLSKQLQKKQEEIRNKQMIVKDLSYKNQRLSVDIQKLSKQLQNNTKQFSNKQQEYKKNIEQLLKTHQNQKLKAKNQHTLQIQKYKTQIQYLRSTLVSEQQSLKIRKQYTQILQKLSNLQQQNSTLKSQLEIAKKQAQDALYQKNIIQKSLKYDHQKDIKKYKDKIQYMQNYWKKREVQLKVQISKLTTMKESFQQKFTKTYEELQTINRQLTYCSNKDNQNKIQMVKKQREFIQKQRQLQKKKDSMVKQCNKKDQQLRKTQKELEKSIRANLLYSHRFGLDILHQQPQVFQFASTNFGKAKNGPKIQYSLAIGNSQTNTNTNKNPNNTTMNGSTSTIQPFQININQAQFATSKIFDYNAENANANASKNNSDRNNEMQTKKMNSISMGSVSQTSNMQKNILATPPPHAYNNNEPVSQNSIARAPSLNQNQNLNPLINIPNFNFNNIHTPPHMNTNVKFDLNQLPGTFVNSGIIYTQPPQQHPAYLNPNYPNLSNKK